MSGASLMLAICIGVGLAVSAYIINRAIEAGTESELRRFRDDLEAILKQKAQNEEHVTRQ